MTSQLVLLTPENHEEFLPCIVPYLHSRLAEPVIFGFGIVAGRIDEPEVPAGAIVCEYDAGVVTVLSVVVLPHLRRQGLGSRLLRYTIQACAAQGFIELEASCWSVEGDACPLERFFVDNGFESIQGDETHYIVAIGDIAGSPLERHLSGAHGGGASGLMELAAVPQHCIPLFLRDFDLTEDIFDNVDPQTSCVIMSNGRINGAALLSKVQEDAVEVIYLCSQTKDGRTTAAVLFGALGRLYRTAPPDTLVIFAPTGDVVTRIAQRLLEGCKTEERQERRLYYSLLPLWEPLQDDPTDTTEDDQTLSEQEGE